MSDAIWGIVTGANLGFVFGALLVNWLHRRWDRHQETALRKDREP